MDSEPMRPMPANEMTEGEIDQNLADSFPASDPPSWTLGLDDHTVSNSRNEGRFSWPAGSPSRSCSARPRTS